MVGPGRRMHLKFTDWSEGNNNVVWLLLTWKYYVSSVVFRLQDVVTISNPISHSWSLDLYFNPPDLTSRHELLKKLGSPNIFQNRWEIRRQKTLKWMYFKLSWLLFGLLVTPSTNYPSIDNITVSGSCKISHFITRRYLDSWLSISLT